MDIEQFSAEMAQRGCTRIQDSTVFCGTYENYPFSVQFLSGKPGGATNFSVIFIFGKAAKPRLFKPLRDSLKPRAKIGVAAGGGASLLHNILVKNPADLPFVFDSLVAGLVQTARAAGLAPPQECPICKRPGCDAYAFVAPGFRPVHAACVQQQSGAQLEAAADNEANGSYATGVIGALLGALAGTLPNVLLIFALQRIFAILCALIPLGAYYGYKLLRGRMNRAVLPVVIIFSVLMTPMVDFLAELAYGLAEGYTITPMQYIQVFMLYPEEFLPALGQILLFIAIGIFIVFSRIRQTNTHFSSQAVSTLASLRPMAAYSVAAPVAPAPVAPPPAPPMEG